MGNSYLVSEDFGVDFVKKRHFSEFFLFFTQSKGWTNSLAGAPEHESSSPVRRRWVWIKTIDPEESHSCWRCCRWDWIGSFGSGGDHLRRQNHRHHPRPDAGKPRLPRPPFWRYFDQRLRFHRRPLQSLPGVTIDLQYSVITFSSLLPPIHFQ